MFAYKNNCDIVPSHCTLYYSTRMATPDHCTVCKKSLKILLHHLNQSLACKAHYMASEKAATTIPTIVSKDGHVNAGNLSQGSTPRTLRPNLTSYLSRGSLPVFEIGGTVEEADDELRVEDVNEVEADFVFDDDAVPEGDADDHIKNSIGRRSGSQRFGFVLETVQAASKPTWSCTFFLGGEGPN